MARPLRLICRTRAYVVIASCPPNPADAPLVTTHVTCFLYRRQTTNIISVRFLQQAQNHILRLDEIMRNVSTISMKVMRWTTKPRNIIELSANVVPPFLVLHMLTLFLFVDKLAYLRKLHSNGLVLLLAKIRSLADASFLHRVMGITVGGKW